MNLRQRIPFILAIAILSAWLIHHWLYQSQVEPQSITASSSASKSKRIPGLPASGSGSTSTTPPTPPVSMAIDPEVQKLADQLNAPDNTAQRDLEIVHDFIQLYHRAYGSNPIGLNEDITAAMTGNYGQGGRVFPPNSPAIRNGKLVDRWGTPYYFHPESGFKMEIRSCGPDKELFTADDILLGP